MLALLAVGIALTASGESTRVELQTAGQIDVRTINTSLPQTSPPVGRWLGGDGVFGATVFGRKLLDDDAAPPLQPFLQRTARFHVDAGGGGASIAFPFRVPLSQTADNPRYEARSRMGAVATSADGYVKPWLWLAASLRLEYMDWEPADNLLVSLGGFSPTMHLSSAVTARLDSSEVTINASVAAGARFRDVLVSAGWTVTPYRIGSDSMDVRFWGNVFIAVSAVVRRSIALRMRIDVVENGATVEASATVWFLRRIGLSLGVEGGHGAFVDSPTIYDRGGGNVRIAWWFSRRVGASLSYAPAWQRSTPVYGFGTAVRDFSFIAHVLSLTLTARPAGFR